MAPAQSAYASLNTYLPQIEGFPTMLDIPERLLSADQRAARKNATRLRKAADGLAAETPRKRTRSLGE